MGGTGNLAEVAQELNVGRQMTERVVADQTAVRLPAELPELLFVNLFKERALVPRGIGELPKMPVELGLADVHHPDLEHGVGLGLKDQMFKTAPSALNLLKLRSMHDLIQLRRKLLIQLRDHFLDRIEDVRLDEAGVGECLLDQRLDRVLHFSRSTFRPWLEILFEKRSEFFNVLGLDERFLLGGRLSRHS